MNAVVDATPFPEGRRPGGRSARVRAEVLAAVEQELTEHGYDGLTVDGVAARSGVHRTSIYRRWKTVDGLLVDLLESGRDDTWTPADTGALTTDLIALNRELHTSLAGTAPTSAVIAAAFRAPAAAAALTRFWDDRYRRSAVVITRAIARGELPATTDPDRVLMAATSPLFHQLALRRQPMTEQEADRWATDAAAAAEAGTYRA
ncbi:TetR/AcrR family transcriptional regulator [Kribbella sp. DT2]|uniref:TetR/AcrR family transcriptional regulator n=1 Tax=Kribbella sp. DT2 TaxID=3393427 RepID=UPI003CF8A9DB